MKAENLVLLPTSLFAVAVLGLNDHVLKAHVPGFLTGKLSDFAGLYFFPFFLLSIAATVWPRAGSKRGLAVACALTALVFSCINLSPVASALYEQVVAGIWRLFGIVRHVRNVADAGDLMALPMVALAFYVGASATARSPAAVGHLRENRQPADRGDGVARENPSDCDLRAWPPR